MSEISVPHRSVTAGTIRRIRLENFMCHSSLQIEFCDYVNFITGQNGSGKSAILTALCVAFGCRAKSTQRGSTLKDFIKTGCSYASVMVEVKNEGDDAFKPEIYGDTIIVERRITDSSSTTVLKDEQGKKVSSRKEELRELVEHFNIDVENPCVIMTQDKSREFLHTGNAKDKFKFFFKATLLQQVDELLQNIGEHLESANELVHDLEKSIEPIVKELSELQEKIKNMEHIEELSVRIKELKKKLAWSWVYDVDNKLEEKVALIEKLRERKPACEAKINKHLAKMEDLKDCFATKRDQYAHLGERNSEVTRTRNELEQSLSMATKHMLELEEEHLRKMNDIQKLMKNVKAIEQQFHDIEERNLQNTQAEEGEMQEKIEGLQHEVDAANSLLIRFKEEENTFFDRISSAMNEIRSIIDEIKEYEKKERDISVSIRELRQHQANKVTAFGGERVIELLRLIELHHRRFRRPPIGPIGAHLVRA